MLIRGTILNRLLTLELKHSPDRGSPIVVLSLWYSPRKLAG
eukprot:SAG31_NODE_22317_length_528_cov_1.083916_1_plen_40_part_10